MAEHVARWYSTRYLQPQQDRDVSGVGDGLLDLVQGEKELGAVVGVAVVHVDVAAEGDVGEHEGVGEVGHKQGEEHGEQG